MDIDKLLRSEEGQKHMEKFLSKAGFAQLAGVDASDAVNGDGPPSGLGDATQAKRQLEEFAKELWDGCRKQKDLFFSSLLSANKEARRTGRGGT